MVLAHRQFAKKNMVGELVVDPNTFVKSFFP